MFQSVPVKRTRRKVCEIGKRTSRTKRNAYSKENDQGSQLIIQLQPVERGNPT